MWTTEFYCSKAGTRFIKFIFEGFATIHYSVTETSLFRNGERLVCIQGDIKASELMALIDRTEKDYLTVKNFSHDIS